MPTLGVTPSLASSGVNAGHALAAASSPARMSAASATNTISLLVSALNRAAEARVEREADAQRTEELGCSSPMVIGTETTCRIPFGSGRARCAPARARAGR